MQSTITSTVFLFPWDTTPGVFDFVCGSSRGWASREEQRNGKPGYWSVKHSGADGRSWRECRVALKRGRTLKVAILDSLEACPERPTTSPDGIFGSFAEVA